MPAAVSPSRVSESMAGVVPRPCLLSFAGALPRGAGAPVKTNAPVPDGGERRKGAYLLAGERSELHEGAAWW